MTRNDWPLDRVCPRYPHTHEGAVCVMGKPHDRATCATCKTLGGGRDRPRKEKR